MRCHYISVKGVGRVLVPGCMAVAVSNDISRCTCHNTTYLGFEREEYNKEVARLKNVIKKLEYENEYLTQLLEDNEIVAKIKDSMDKRIFRAFAHDNLFRDDVSTVEFTPKNRKYKLTGWGKVIEGVVKNDIYLSAKWSSSCALEEKQNTLSVQSSCIANKWVMSRTDKKSRCVQYDKQHSGHDISV